MNIARLLKPTALFVTLILLFGCCGCIRLFGTIEVTKPDPLRKKAVKIVKVTGMTVTLADGRQIEMAGLKPASYGQDPYHLKGIQAWMANELLGKYVVVVPETQGKGRVINISMYDKTKYRGPACLLLAPFIGYSYADPVPVVTLIPIFVEKKRLRFDLGASILGRGQAKLVPEEIADPKVRAEYVTSAESARSKKLGIWKSMDERVRNKNGKNN